MDTITFEDFELEFELTGSGEPVMLCHASPFVSWYEPLLPHLHGVTVLRYRRRLRQGTGDIYRPLTIEEDARACARLLDHVDWPRAHMVGHSYGALIVLEIGADDTGRALTLTLLEPAARGISSSEQVAAALTPVMQTYIEGDAERAMDMFLQHVGGPGYRTELDRLLPDAFSEAVAEADLFFQAEMAAVRSFEFNEGRARKVAQPVLNLVGAQSVHRFVEGAALVQSWFPQADKLTIPDAGHMLMVQNPEAVGEALLGFIARHSIDGRAPSAIS